MSPSEEASRHNYLKYHMGGIRVLPPVAYIQHLTHSRLNFNQLLHLNEEEILGMKWLDLKKDELRTMDTYMDTKALS